MKRRRLHTLLLVCVCAWISGCTQTIDQPDVAALYAQAQESARTSNIQQGLFSPVGGAGQQAQGVAVEELRADAFELPAPSQAGKSEGIANIQTKVAPDDEPEFDYHAERVVADPKPGKRISEYFQQTDLREALDILASISSNQVIIDDTVSGIVTAQFEQATFEEALQKLLMPLGYVYSKREDAYIVAPPDPESPLFHYVSERWRYEPKHRLASKLVELLPERYIRYYQLSDEQNIIMIEAPLEIGDEVLKRLQELDQPIPQVELEAIVCVTAPDSGFRFGMDWNHVLSANDADQFSAGLSGLALNAAASQYGLQNMFDDFAVTSAFVQLLSQKGYVTIRAQPRVTTKDGEEAIISINRETFFSLQPSTSNVLFRQDVQKVDAGITLQITPRIRGDQVSVEITRAEVSEDIRNSDTRSELTNNPYPIINRRQVSTKVDVRDGHTIVIGGLVQRQTVDRVSKIPFLSSVPVVGNLFKKVEKQEQDAEVAIFISPRIVTEK